MLPARTADAVLFDFSATLFDDVAVWSVTAVRAMAAARGIDLDDDQAARLIEASQLTANSPRGLEMREGCDRSAQRHRAVWMELLTSAATGLLPGLPAEGLGAVIYACLTDPLSWQPYPDTAPVLNALHEAGLALGVVSNVGWDIRPSFDPLGLTDLIGSFTLSCEHGMVKPEPRLFEVACAELGLAPERILFVGDDPVRDGAATVVGMPVYLLPRNRSVTRPRGLAGVLGLAGC